jgi:hypothetical protein
MLCWQNKEEYLKMMDAYKKEWSFTLYWFPGNDLKFGERSG